jgi:small GTP-binding protein
MDDLKCEIVPDSSNYDLNFKLLLIGDAGVGKSCITTRATKDYFDDSYVTTIGFDFFSLNIMIDEQNIKLQIWDTCGQEIYRSLISSFYRNSSLAFLVYSIDSYESFINLKNWLNELKINSNPDIKLFLIGNKVDLINDRKIESKQGQDFANENNFSYFMETSAKDGTNVKESFIYAAKLLYNEHLNYIDRSQRNGTLADVVNILPNNNDIVSKEEKRTVSGGCCG